ncbi:RagB/SusD family nutrient uptake outer membrane protein [Halosquirtibacter xylanolyticus]|uniref:RagB/SusD family nutrient uptake outer membrane protein n=1 Tax=Halosquirtibacter xylanolyticus TaxID=3374599 RepID=UPI003748EE73|nr:RagB/SusD family nutrient uptake outer membrane protein [Prolixibacteraceae bacterium]
MNYKNIAKRGVFAAWAIASLCLTSSCERVLEVTPKSVFSTDSYFNSVDQAEQSVIGIYDVLSRKETYSQFLSLALPLDNDITYVKGPDMNNDFRLIGHYGLSPYTSYIESAWKYLYQGIGRANLAIDRIQQMNQFKNGSEKEVKALNKLLGEAKFMRAFLYFDLVRCWGDVPLVLKPMSLADDPNISRSDRNLVYDQIIKDLKEAKDLMPESILTSHDRANQGAIRGYLVRALLYKASYFLAQDGNITQNAEYKNTLKEAAVEAKELDKLGQYTLLDSFEQVFKNELNFNPDPKENLFVIAFYNVSHATTDAGNIGTWNSPPAHKAAPCGRANAYVFVRPDFMDEYEDTDIRKSVSVADFQIDKTGKQKPLKAKAVKYPGKWRRNWIGEKSQNHNNTNVDWCTLRYSDVLLMMAEAINETRDELPTGVTLADAFEAINRVRKRAGLADLDNSLSYEELRMAIRKERKLEFVGEGWRKFDLIRWNIMDKTMKDTQASMDAKYPSKKPKYPNAVGYVAGKNFTTGKHELLPIPQREINENNALKQNPNYDK